MAAPDYRHVTDAMWCDYLESQGTPLQDWFASEGTYGFKTPEGQLMIVMDDDDERVIAIEAYLRRLGQVQSQEQSQG